MMEIVKVGVVVEDACAMEVYKMIGRFEVEMYGSVVSKVCSQN